MSVLIDLPLPSLPPEEVPPEEVPPEEVPTEQRLPGSPDRLSRRLSGRPQRVEPEVRPGPELLAGLADGPGLSAHRRRVGPVAQADAEELAAVTDAAGILGRGGAGFPFATKLRAALSKRGPREVVVNAAEGEPASGKDAALLRHAPHRVLDGAAATALALGSREVHLVVPVERPEVGAAARAAIDERGAAGERLHWRVHLAADRFVAGQSYAVTELLAGRSNLPVTGWAPQAYAGHRGRPTLLSNAETFAHVGAALRLGPAGYRALGEGDECGTTLLTLGGDAVGAAVCEVPLGTPWEQVLDDAELDRPVLLGGYHGSWAPAGGLRGHRVSRTDLADCGWTLGAGVVLPLVGTRCVLRRTAQLTRYLAGQVAGRCGPCRNGLPALAAELTDLADRADIDGAGTSRAGTRGADRDHDRAQEVEALLRLVRGRGACAHPDGTARLVASALEADPGEVDRHRAGRCIDEARHG